MAGSPPLIGCTTYHKRSDQDPPIEVFGLMPTYTEAIAAAGGLPVMIPLGLREPELEAILERLDGLLLPGGGDIWPTAYHGDATHPTVRDVNPDRDRVELFLARQAVTREKPLLAICRGHQVLNVALGGTLWEDVGSQRAEAFKHDYYGVHPRGAVTHEVRIRPGSLVARALDREVSGVNSLHHQGIRRLAPLLEIVADAPDGLPEAVEVPGHPYAVGVQWHPEAMIYRDPAMLGLFRDLVSAAARVSHSANGTARQPARLAPEAASGT